MAAKWAPRPFVQGALDGLCGVYSIINGLTWALHTHKVWVGKPARRTRHLTCRESEELFAALTTALLKRKRRGAPIVDGLHSLDMSYLLRKSALWLEEHYDTELRVVRPFYHRRQFSMRKVVQRLTLHLSVPGGAAIIGIESPWKHWTVAISVKRAHLQLLDSDGLARLSLERQRRHRREASDLLSPSGLFLLSVQKRSAPRSRWV